MRFLTLALVFSAACSITVDTDGRACTQDADCAENQICREGVCQAGVTERTCVPAAYQQCDGQDIRSFNSCDEDEGVVDTCVTNAICTLPTAGVAECVCNNRWEGAGCDACPIGVDEVNDCSGCLPGYDVGASCSTCLGQRNPSDACQSCNAGWTNINDDDCGTCTPGRDINSDCTACLGNRDLSADCLTCLPGWAEVDGNDCGTCVRYVDPGATGDGSGLSWDDAFTSIPSAVADAGLEAAAGRGNLDETGVCEVWVRAGTYVPTTPSGTSVAFLVPENVRLYGGFGPAASELDDRNPGVDETILDGESNALHVVIPAGAAVIDGFTIRGGSASGSDTNGTLGGGMLVDGATPTVRNCRFVDNSTASNLPTDGYGGAIALLAGDVTIENCDFVNNSTEFGGGAIYALDGTSVVIANSTFTNNRTNGGMGGGGNGGAIRLVGNATLSVQDSAFTMNQTETGLSAATYGGAIYQTSTSAVTIRNTTFDGNISGNGGAIAIEGTGTLDIQDGTFIDNTATGSDLTAFGGALYLGGGTTVVRRTLFESNEITNVRAAGGVAYIVNSADATFVNTVMRDNEIIGGAYARGGALWLGSSANTQVVNTTIYGNTATNSPEGGGIYLNGTDRPFELINVINWGNTPDGIFGCCGSTDIQVTEFYNSQDGALRVGPNTISYDDPQFVGGEPFDLRLQMGSPRIDNGGSPLSFPNVPSVDIDGNARPLGGGYDIGAYEYVP